MANPLVGGTRAALGQGVMMGWGDEAEAWLRSKLGQGSYEDLLKKIRSEYGQFAEQYPISSGVAEFGGGALPGVAAMFVPGMQPAGAAQLTAGTGSALSRLAARPITKAAVAGGTTGAISGAGSAVEGERGSGAVVGGGLGAGLGVAVPPLVRAAGAGRSWLMDRMFPSAATAEERATKLLSKSLERSQMTPQQMEAALAADRAMGVPSTVANVSPSTARLARGTAKTGGAGADVLQQKLSEQVAGAPERLTQQVTKALKPADYFDSLRQLNQRLATKAAPYYQEAYQYGEVTDPKVLQFLELPQFKAGLTEANKLLAAEGRKMPTVEIIDPVTGAKTSKIAPTVEVLDQVKRGIDALIEKETDAVTGKVSKLGSIYIQKKNEFLDNLDALVPKYAEARKIYADDAQIKKRMQEGLEQFNRAKPEEIKQTVSKMSPGELEAYRTGVARYLYGVIDRPSRNVNTANELINSRAIRDKMLPLFNNEAEFNLYKAALQREAQLHGQASRIMFGSDTAENQQLISAIQESGETIGQFIQNTVTGGWMNSLSNAVLGALSKAQLTEETAERLARKLVAEDPVEVAAVVKALENYAKSAAPRAAGATRKEIGATTGAAVSAMPSPAPETTALDIEADMSSRPAIPEGPDIEADIEAERKKLR